jgi:hypothetical protein
MRNKKLTQLEQNEPKTTGVSASEKFFITPAPVTPKKVKALIPRQLHNITKTVFTGSPLHSKRDSRGQEDWQGTLTEVWQKSGVLYGVKTEDKDKLKGIVPKISVSQDKNIKLLLAMIEQQQYGKDDKEPEAVFTLKDYATLRGFSEAEIARGGKFMDELKRDLYSGAYMTYRVDKIVIDGKTYTAHGIPNFYTLLEPANQKGEWRVRFNPFYVDKIMEVLKGEAHQFYTHQLKEIGDRKTTEKEYLHHFYNLLVETKGHTKCSMPMKVRTALTKMGVSDKILKRPQESFKVLKESLIYTATYYPEELESIILSQTGDFTKPENKGKAIPLSHLQDLGKLDYETIKTMLHGMGVTDIRDCFISFCQTSEVKKLTAKPHTTHAIQISGAGVVNEILDWLEDYERRTDYPMTWTPEQRRKFLGDCEKCLGTNRLRELFTQAGREHNANPIRFLSKELPAEMKRYKTTKKSEETRQQNMDDLRGMKDNMFKF